MICYGRLYNRKHENKITAAESFGENWMMAGSTISARIGWMSDTIDADNKIGVSSDTGLEITRR
jgi:hypothetical protein